MNIFIETNVFTVQYFPTMCNVDCTNVLVGDDEGLTKCF